MKKTFLLLLLPLLTLVLWTGCKKDPPCDDPANPECPNYDKCLTVVETNADFEFVADVGDGFYLPFRDSIPVTLNGQTRIYFRASDNRMSGYEWKVGLDPRVFTDSLFSLMFPGTAGWINVDLTVSNNKANSTCFPGDTGRTTFQKAFYLKTYTASTREEELAQCPIFGTYLGYPEGNPQDTSQITISYPHLFAPAIYNLLTGCPVIANSTYYNTHYFMVNGTVGPNAQTCHKPYVFAELAPDNRTLTVDYAVTQYAKRVKGRWIGQKVN